MESCLSIESEAHPGNYLRPTRRPMRRRDRTRRPRRRCNEECSPSDAPVSNKVRRGLIRRESFWGSNATACQAMKQECGSWRAQADQRTSVAFLPNMNPRPPTPRDWCAADLVPKSPPRTRQGGFGRVVPIDGGAYPSNSPAQATTGLEEDQLAHKWHVWWRTRELSGALPSSVPRLAHNPCISSYSSLTSLLPASARARLVQQRHQ